MKRKPGGSTIPVNKFVPDRTQNRVAPKRTTLTMITTVAKKAPPKRGLKISLYEKRDNRQFNIPLHGRSPYINPLQSL